MNLIDKPKDKELKQDELTLSKPLYGEYSQLSLVGWNGQASQGKKKYVLYCSICAKDPELFGDGYFWALAGNIGQGRAPCGCSKQPSWNKDQYIVMCHREATKRGYNFLGMTGEYKGHKTRISLECVIHGVFSSIMGALSSKKRRVGCKSCMGLRTGLRSLKPDAVMIESFFKSEGFHPETKFYRSERRSRAGKRAYWYMECPDCGEKGEATTGALQKGSRPCACSHMSQKEAYINTVTDIDLGIAIALKFGIAKNSKERAKRQNGFSVFKVETHSIYKFATVQSCKRAENQCAKQLECGIILRRDMPDGFSETTWVYNLDKIIEIYESNGGIQYE